MSEIFQKVKHAVTAKQAAERYGLKVNRYGMACCPFHDDRTPSMKVGEKYYCFACCAKGDSIDLAAGILGLNLKEATEQLAKDFGISYDVPKVKTSKKTRGSPLPSQEKEYQQAEDGIYRIYSDYYHLLRWWSEKFAPKSIYEDYDPRFVEACQKRCIVEYYLDTLLYGSIEERAAFIVEHAKDVIKLEKRIQEFT